MDARAAFAADFDVSRETLQKFDAYLQLLQKWQKTINLVGPKTLDDVWMRHFSDSAQLKPIHPHADKWLDLGSGAGFPGLVLALLSGDRSNFTIDLVEVDQRKSAFLREVIRATGAPAKVHVGLVQDVIPHFTPDVVTSRALAPLDTLIKWTLPLLSRGSKAVFPKGRDAASELTRLAAIPNIRVELKPSRTDPLSSLVLVEMAGARTGID
jgi:16S rRNA (guanine527-N7)-methyltransferase